MRKRDEIPPLSSDEHAVASERHARSAGELCPTSSEWAAVVYFYAAYHLVKQAILEDPIWQCPSKLAAKHPELQPSVSKVTRHSGGKQRRRRRGRTWGVNEVVELLYPSIYQSYLLMHQASIEVRYLRGLRTPVRVSAAHWAKIRAEFRAGRMRAT
jgi:hypothetical protein